jgi:hypothetical protein
MTIHRPRTESDVAEIVMDARAAKTPRRARRWFGGQTPVILAPCA